ncbi:MAG TPA: FAD:protein FMN transferase [Candidatus Coprosoma intestinipullorum]|uniref:FAD:protein FMN transferase n=1 Tax=Candidatus Coprosoma intestinipullorum TaxID=2840752 RepID=A0A9D0ZQY4_9FIRM|nr:FAD:protein FMN transferase [Candidatus Coprosoma intestinipullorum]
MKLLIEKRNYLILGIIVLLVIWILFNLFSKREVYMDSFDYFGESITIKVYDKVNQNNLSEDINKILKGYEDGEKDDDLIEYGRLLYMKSNGYIDISDTDLVKALRRGENYKFKSKINDDDFKDFDLDMIKASYAISEVCDYFKQNNIESYIINEGGNVITGDSYDDDKYTVSLSKYDSEEVLDIVLLENKSLYTLNKSDEITEYSVNPKTSEAVDNFDSVSVIANDNLTADMLVRTLFLMSEDDGRKYIENFNAEALWQKGDEVSMTDGFKNYLQK